VRSDDFSIWQTGTDAGGEAEGFCQQDQAALSEAADTIFPGRKKVDPALLKQLEDGADFG